MQMQCSFKPSIMDHTLHTQQYTPMLKQHRGLWLQNSLDLLRR